MHPTIACRDCRQGEALEVLHVLDVNIDLADAESRLREWLLGGTTRNILQQAQLPVLMCH